MDTTKKTARLAGLLYFVASLPAPFALIYVPGKIFVEGDPAATAEKLRTLGGLVRAGIAASLVSGIIFIFAVLVLYRLFKPVAEWSALAMFVLILISFPISFSSVASQVSALHLAGGGDLPAFAAALDAPQRDALAYHALRQHHQFMMVAEIFWGLWLFPFGICVMRSGFIPRIIGILLMIAGAGYVVDSFVELSRPQLVPVVDRISMITGFCELPILLWLLIWGAKPQRQPLRPTAAS